VSNNPDKELPRGLRSVLGDSVVYGLSVAATPLALALATPFVARKLEPSDYGLLDVMVTFVSLVSLVTLLGMDAAVSRTYLDIEPTESDQRARVITTGLFAVTAAGVAAVGTLGVVGVSVAIALGSLSLPFLAAGAAGALSVPLSNAQAVARTSFALRRQRTRFTAAGLLQAGAGAAAAVVLVFLGLGPAGFLLGLALGTAAALGYSHAVGNLRPTRGPWVDRDALATMLRYGVPLVPATAAAWMIFAVDRTLIAALRNFTEAGYYGLASKVTVPMMLAISAFGVAWGPYILGQPDLTRPETRARALTAASAAAAGIYVCVVTFRRELVLLLGGPEFEPATRAVPGIALGWLGWAAAMVLASEFGVVRRTRVIAVVVGVSALLNVVLNVALIPPFGFVGAAWAAAITFLLAPFGYWIWERRSGLAPYRYGRLALIGAVALCATAGPALMGDVGGIAAKAAVCVMALALLGWIGAFDRTKSMAV
jgi:O-antigen/teichoic acid export membrane protein